MSLLRPVSCQREIGTKFMCRVIDVEMASGTLPTDISFSETRKSTIGDTECFYVNGLAIKKGPEEEDAVFYNSDDRSIEFDEYKDPMGKFGICRKRWEKQGIAGILNSTLLFNGFRHTGDHIIIHLFKGDVYSEIRKLSVYYRIPYTSGVLSCKYKQKGWKYQRWFGLSSVIYHNGYVECKWPKGRTDYDIKLEIKGREYFTDAARAFSKALHPPSGTLYSTTIIQIQFRRHFRKHNNFKILLLSFNNFSRRFFPSR